MAASTASTPSPKTQKSRMNPYTTSVSPPSRPSTFDASLFSMDASGSPSLSQPYQPALPAIRNNNSRSPNGKRPASPSSLYPDHSLLLNSPSSNLSGASPITNCSYHNMNYQRGPGSHSSPNPSYFDHSTGERHSMDDVDRFTTTPNFDEVEMPPMSEYELDDGLSGTAYSTPATGAGGGGGGLTTFPPSPRPTISPSPGIGSYGNEDVQIKVEQFTPAVAPKGLGVHIQHPTPVSHASSASSSNPTTKPAPPAIGLTVDKRGEDGVLRGGYDPEMRAAMGAGENAEIPSLNDQAIIQQREIKSLEIQDWLDKNNTTTIERDGKEGKPGGLTVKGPKRVRSKSFSDFRRKGSSTKGADEEEEIIKVGESSAGAITGVLIIDDDEDIRPGEYDYEDGDSSDASLSNDGSLDDDDESMNTSEAPPTEEALKRAELDDEYEQMRIDNDPALLPNPKQFYSARPWTDTIGPMPRGTNGGAMKCQPTTANGAIYRFREYAHNIETASRVATFGSETSKNNRGLSNSDVDRIAEEGSLLKRLSFRNKEKGQGKDATSPPGHSRKPSLMQSFMKGGLKRGHSNASDKFKESSTRVSVDEEEKEGSVGDSASMGRKRGDSVVSSISATSFAPLKTRPSWSKPGTLKVDTNVHGALVSMAGVTAGIGQSSGHTASTAKPASPTPPEKRPTGLSVGSHVMQTIRRARSKSELATGSRLHKNSKPAFGIVSMLGQYGGPPLVPIKSPVASGGDGSRSAPTSGGNRNSHSDGGSQSAPDATIQPRFTFGEETSKRGLAAASLLDPHRHDGYDDSDDEGVEEIVNKATQAPIQGQKQQKLDITPNVEGFTAHIKSKTPELSPKLVERIVYEQGKRFKKLVEHRQKHLSAIKNGGKCSNHEKCRGKVGSIGAGGQEENRGHKRNNSGGSVECEAYSSDETTGDHSPTEGKVAATQFPSGVPQPPVSRLPAEFECPICFKVKKFTKPSDWTKHVHEDVHPFTCTFIECTEPKSFKRKADWVRHENERHRHLEWWTCNIPDCTHTCYRKDNFVQHLVREHKMPEPKVKAQRAVAKAAKTTGKKGKAAKAVAGADGAPTQEDLDKVWNIVEDCHQVTTKLATQEKCRFCGVTCATWKKLTVHLARHMEHISLPVLDLITDDAVVPPSTRGSGKQAPTRSANTAPVAPMPKVQHQSTDMDIDSIGGGGDVSGQRQQTMDASYEDHTQYTVGNTNYSSHHTPPRSSPHIPMDNHFNVSTSPQGQYSTPGGLGFGSEQRIHSMQNVSGLQPMINPPFEYTRNEVYSSSSPMTGGTLSINDAYSSSPLYPQRPLPHSPVAQRMTPVMTGQQHLQVQQRTQQGYIAYEHASGQYPVDAGLGMGQMHTQAVANANSLIEGHGQYGYYPGAEIPMALMGVAMAPMDNNDEYNFIH